MWPPNAMCVSLFCLWLHLHFVYFQRSDVLVVSPPNYTYLFFYLFRVSGSNGCDVHPLWMFYPHIYCVCGEGGLRVVGLCVYMCEGVFVSARYV